MKIDDDKGAITTMTASILVVMLVAMGLLAFNEYERSNLRQEALTQTTSDIVVGDYRYSFSNLTKVLGMSSGATNIIDVFGDKVIWTTYYNNVFTIRGYNLTTQSHFIIKTTSLNYPITYTDIGNGIVSWTEDTSATITENHVKCYIFSNGTTWTSPQQTWAGESITSVVVGDYVVYCPAYNHSGGTTIDMWRFDTKNWTNEPFYTLTVQESQEGIFLGQGGVEDELIYSSSTTGYHRLNIRTGATTPLASPYNPYRQTHMNGIYDDAVGITDLTAYKFKAINFKTGKSTTLDNITYGSNTEYRQPISCWNDNFFSYFIIDPIDPTRPLLRFYDTDTDTRFAIPHYSAETLTGWSGIGMSDKYVAVMFYNSMYFYTYSRTPSEATSNTTGNGTSNETAIPETNLEKVQGWLQDNWAYIVVIGIVVGVALFYGYKKFASSPKYREVGAKKNLNWGLIIAIGVITLLAIIFMV